MSKYLSFSFLIVFSLLFSCQDDDGNAPHNNGQNYNPTEFAQNFGNSINRTFLGTVIDKNHNPIPDVTITIGNTMAQTDANGVFIITDAPVYERFGYVKAEKTGYITGSRSIVPSEGTNKVEIMLLEETVIATVNSGSLETVTLSNGASVELPGNYSKEDGTAYTGSVNVILHHLDPTDDDMQLQMPGMLYAANSENQERLLQTFGMLAVELKGSSGEALNLAEGSTAEITVPLDASLLSDAPATIPLWHFDEEYGYWIEDGVATLVGNTYVGTVSHFSFWNCDIPFEAVTLCVTVKDINGVGLSYTLVSLDNLNFGNTAGLTDNNGEVCGFIPANEILQLEVFPNIIGDCAEEIYSSQIGPFNEDSEILIQITDFGDLIFETVTGNFSTCDSEPVEQGYVFLNHQGVEFSDFVDNGSFEINLLHCNDDSTFYLQAYDNINLQVTDSIAYTYTSPVTNIGTIRACDAVDEFIYFNIDNGEEEHYITYNITEIEFREAEINPEFGYNPALVMNITDPANTHCFHMLTVLNPYPFVGSYNYVDTINPSDIGFLLLPDCISMSPEDNNVIFHITSFGEIGEYIDINFAGNYQDYQGNPHHINCIIHVRRDY